MTAAKHFNWRDMISAADDTPGSVIEALDDYFTPFAELHFEEATGDKKKISKEQPCLGCGKNMTPGLAGIVLDGGFTWGIAHGEGHCKSCHWPARAYHRPSDDKGEIFFLNQVIQYHPDFVKKRKAS